jgi:hypothetical protein
MVGKIEFSPEIIEYLDSLVFKLYEKEYFGFIENSFEYIENLVQHVMKEIHSIPHKKTPKELISYRNFYMTYHSNQRTTWYILFDKNEEDILVTFIFNNHEKFATYLDL